MKELTSNQIKTRWTEIKKLIRSRQLLAYRVGIDIKDWDRYMHSTPPESEVNRIYDVIHNDRKIKTKRIRDGLSKIIGYRESKEYSRRTGISDTSIRQIIEGKKEMAGYDLINRFEMFLHMVLPDFDLSIENPLDEKKFVRHNLMEIALEIDRIADNLKMYCFELTKFGYLVKKGNELTSSPLDTTSTLDNKISELKSIKNRIDMFCRTYIDGNRKYQSN
jgi:transcriptional regulator with XRE-family HTH domain